MDNPILDFLRSDGSIVVNKKLIHAIGLAEAVLYSELVSKHFYFKNRGQLEDEYFFNTADNLQLDTGLTPKQQRSAIDKLESLNLIKTKLKGVPAKKYFKIEQELTCLYELMATGKKNQQFGTFVTSSKAKRSQQDRQKGHSNNTNVISLSNNPNIDYILLSQNDHSFVSSYLSIRAEYRQGNHKPLTKGNYDKVMTFIETVEETVEYNDWVTSVEDYFEQLPVSNDGDICSFMYAAFRYFEVNAITMEY